MVFERATPPALRWVLVFLGVCAALGIWLGFKDQIRRNPPAWYTGAPEPTYAGQAPVGADGVREATAFDPSARTASQQAESAATTEPKKAEADDEDDAAETATAPTETPATTTATPATAAPGATPPTTASPTPARPRPATPPSRPAPSTDPVGDILDGQRPPAQPAPSDVPY